MKAANSNKIYHNELVSAKKYDQAEQWERFSERSLLPYSSTNHCFEKSLQSKSKFVDHSYATQKFYPEKSKFKAFGNPRELLFVLVKGMMLALDQSRQLMWRVPLKNLKGSFDQKISKEDNVKNLYLLAYSRQPKAEKMNVALQHFQSATIQIAPSKFLTGPL